jgi:hypothetical protein
MSPTATSFSVPGDAQLHACIKLVKKASFQANKFEYGNKNEDTSVRQIKRLMLDTSNNWWATWVPPSGPLDVCAFFQRSRLMQGYYVMCVGFDESYMSTMNPDPKKFIDRVAGTGSGDGFLADFIYQLKTPNQDHYVYVVDMPLSSQGAQYNTRLNALFNYARGNPLPNVPWRFSAPNPSNGEKNQDDIFLASGNPDSNAGTGLDFWKLTITPPHHP